MPPVRIVKKNISREKEFNTSLDLSAYGVNDVNDTNQLRTFVQNNASNKEDPILARSVEYTRYRIAALSEIDKRSQELTNPKTGKLSKVIISGKEVDKVEGHPDVTDCFIMDNINQEEKQTSTNGCWSVSMSLLLQSRGVNIDQQMIRAYKPTGDAKYYNDKPMAVEDYMHLIEKVSPNTGLRSRLITSKENFAHLSNIDKNSEEYRNGVAHVADNFKNVVNESLRTSNSPVSLTDNNHYLTVVGTGKKDGKDGFFYKDSLGEEEPNKTYFKTYEEYINEKLANPIPENELKSIQCTFLQDYDITVDKTTGEKKCDQIEGFTGLKFEDGKIKPSEIGKGAVEEGNGSYLIIEPAESGATKDNTIATFSNGDMVETIYFPSKVLEGSPYLSIEASQQEQAVENEFEKPATTALFRSSTYSDYMNNVSRQLESDSLYKRASLPVDFELEDSFNKLSYGNALNDAMSHLRDVNNNHNNLKRMLSNNEPSQRAEEAADAGLTKAVKAAADSINLFLENTNESKNSELYVMMEGLYNKLNSLASEKAAVDAELEMYKNAYVQEHNVTLTNDLDKDIEIARRNVLEFDLLHQEAEEELENAKQDYIKAVESEKTEENAANNLEKNNDKENERLDKAIEDSTKTLHDHFKSLDTVEARLGVKLRDRSAFTEDGQDINDLAATNPFPSELSSDEKEKLGNDKTDLNNKISQEFDRLRNLQSEKENLNKNPNLEEANNLSKNALSRSALSEYNRKQTQLSEIAKKRDDATKHLDTLLAVKQSVEKTAELKRKALSKRNDALVNSSSGLLGLSQGLERVDRKFPFFKVGRNKNSEEFQNLHDKIWEIQNKLTPNLSSEEKNNREVDKDYVLGNDFRNDLKDLKESAQKYVSHIESLNEERGKNGPSSDVGKQRLALANNVISFCNQMSQSFEKRDSLEKLSENEITRTANRNLQPYNLKNDFSNDAVENQKRARDENAKKEADAPKKKSLLEILLELFGFKKSTEDVKDMPSNGITNDDAVSDKKKTESQRDREENVENAEKVRTNNENQVKEAAKEDSKEEKKKEEKIEETKITGKASNLETIAEVDEEYEQDVENEDQKVNKEPVNEEVKEKDKQNEGNLNDWVVIDDDADDIDDSILEELKEKPKMTNAQAEANLEALEKELDAEDENDIAGLNKHKLLPDDEMDSEDEIDDSILDELKEPAKMTNAEAEAQMKELEAEEEKNPTKNNFIDDMIANKKAEDNSKTVVDERTGAIKEKISFNEISKTKENNKKDRDEEPNRKEPNRKEPNKKEINRKEPNRNQKIKLNENQKKYVEALKTKSANIKDVRKQVAALNKKKDESLNKRIGIAQHTKQTNKTLNKGKNLTRENSGPSMGMF